jgi:hypothetical protein
MKKYIYNYAVSFIIALICIYSIYNVHYFNRKAFNSDVMEIVSGKGQEKFFYSDESKEQLMVFYKDNKEYLPDLDLEDNKSVYLIFSKAFGFLLQLTKNISFDEEDNKIVITVRVSEKESVLLYYTYNDNKFKLESFENLHYLNPIIKCINS